MRLLESITSRFPRPILTRRRMVLAVFAAALIDTLQIALGPLGWVGTVQFLDVAACALTCLLVGFHLLLLPSFILELFPIVDMLPTWTGCVLAVIALRRRQDKQGQGTPHGRTAPVLPGAAPAAEDENRQP